jgi:hypothetical protein
VRENAGREAEQSYTLEKEFGERRTSTRKRKNAIAKKLGD